MSAKPEIVLVTTTFYKSPDEPRAQLALKTCRAAQERGYGLVVVDGSPNTEFMKAAEATGTVVQREKERGMRASRSQGLYAGIETGAHVIVWIEPEKHTLVPLLGPCINPVFDEVAEAVIPRRRNLDTYPAYQHFSELRANHEIANFTRRADLDLFFGPRVMSPNAAMVMAQYDGRYGDNWEIIFVPVLSWIARGMRIKTVVVDYVHPEEQRTEDDEIMRGKRDKQRIDLVSCMKRAAHDFDIRGLEQ